MQQPKFVYQLVSFPESFVQVHALIEECYAKKDKKTVEEVRNSQEYKEYLMGGKFRGTFTDKKIIEDILAQRGDPYGICECYYTWLVVEKHYLNSIDGCAYNLDDDERETWYHHVQKEDGSWVYEQVEKPESLKQTFGFL